MAQGKASMSKVADWIGVSAPLLDVEITEVSSIEAAGPQSVVFAMDKETLTKALESKAGADSCEQKSGRRGVAARSAGVVGGGRAVCVCGGWGTAEGARV